MTAIPRPFEVDVVVDGSRSGGAYALLDVRAAAGAVVPRHVGAREEVVVRVIAGRVALRTGREGERELAAGEAAVVPRGVPRALRVLADARLLLLVVPPGAESLAPLLDDPPADADDLAALLAAAGFSRLPSR